MLLSEAKTKQCPHKPPSFDLDGNQVSTCQPIGCMCWVDTSADDTVILTRRERDLGLEQQGYRYDVTYMGYDNYIYKYTKSVGWIEQGYCTLRGDINDTKTN